MPHSILSAYNFNTPGVQLKPFGSGLINNTWKVEDSGKEYILQRINHFVFKKPENIENNIKKVAAYLKKYHPEYNFCAPIKSLVGDEMVYRKEEGYFRMFPFVAVSHTNDVVETVDQAYEAARQFGRFTRLLSGIEMNELKITIPDFHNLSLRYQQFINALETGDKTRIAECSKTIIALKGFNGIVKEYEELKNDCAFKLRVTHHDTKISNVLFDDQDKGLCVIDLDTMMPGYFISDLGDMMRTYLCPVSEEEPDFSKIEIRENIYHAIVNGYYSEMKNELTPTEVNHFFYAGKYMIYMQSLRFITDFLNNDLYYGAKYTTQNKIRGENQLVLLEKFVARETELDSKNILQGVES